MYQIIQQYQWGKNYVTRAKVNDVDFFDIEFHPQRDNPPALKAPLPFAGIYLLLAGRAPIAPTNTGLGCFRLIGISNASVSTIGVFEQGEFMPTKTNEPDAAALMRAFDTPKRLAWCRLSHPRNVST